MCDPYANLILFNSHLIQAVCA